MPDPVAFDLKKDASFIRVLEVIQGIGNMLTELGKQQKASNQRFDDFVANQAVTTPKKKVKDDDRSADDDGEDDDEDEIDEDEIEGMTNAQMFKLMIKEVGKVVDSKVSKVQEQVAGLGKHVVATNTEKEIKEFAKEHPDLLEWREEIAELSKENPNLKLNRLYALVRSENPKKAKKLDAKIAEMKTKSENSDPDADDDEDEDEDAGTNFFGLTPTSRDEKGSKKEAGRMKPQEAVEDAWEKTMAKLPANLIGN